MRPLDRSSRLLLMFLPVLAAPLATAQTAGEGTAPALPGLIWDTRTGATLTMAGLERRLQHARYVLLGEVHDNGSHHRIRRDLIAAMIRDGRRPAIAMEQFDREHQAGIDDVLAAARPDAEQVRSAGRFNAKGWNWPDYAPIVRLAVEQRLPLVAANLSRAEAFRIATAGTAAVFGAAESSALKLNQPLPAQARQKLERALDDGHCGKAPAAMVPGMVAAQRARDAVMASTLEPHAARGAVLIAGNGHVRRDFGVAQYLHTTAGADEIIAVGLIEVGEKPAAPTAYYDHRDPEYDYILFTARQAREDPCTGLRFRPPQPIAQP